MGPVGDQELVRELAAIALEKVAPDELAIFDETATEFFDDPDGVLNPARRDEAVGFGLDAALATPYVLAVVVPVVQFLVTTVVEATKEETRTTIGNLVRRLFRRDAAAPAEPPPLALTPQQASQVRAIAFDRARALGLAEPQARLLADSVGGGVVVAG
jgi:hypothetical protein